MLYMRTPSLHPLVCSGSPSCPAEWMDGIDWPAGVVGESVMANCSVGVATRECLMEGNWGQPNLFDCLSPVSGPWYMCLHTHCRVMRLNATVHLQIVSSDSEM